MAEHVVARGRPGTVKRKTALQSRADTKASTLLADAPQLADILRTEFEADPFSQQLAEVARLIAMRDTLKSQRQVFFVSFNGWDHHHRLLDNQATMLPMLSQGLASFRDALDELGVFGDVTTFTVSEFGRSLTSNGSGSDHGWGGHQIVMGGSVSGGKVYGHYPDLSPRSPQHIGNGVYAPTTSNEEYFTEFATWLGVPASQLYYVFPNLAVLQSSLRGKAPLGLFA
jgi:uncharacterized protein (DUF1501 family)